ncbi:MAG: universal stress protein [Lactobacillus sp.]|nr:universal stress protein [Lactobacillus sp.]
MATQEKILVPVDGSSLAEAAFEKACDMAVLDGAHVDLLNVIDTRQFMGETRDVLISGDAIYQMTQDSEDYLQSLVKRAKKDFNLTDIDYHIRYGSPKRIISYDFIKDHGDDLIVMGATGLNAIERMLIGSVTTYVNHHALADVLIVRTDRNNQPLKAEK